MSSLKAPYIPFSTFTRILDEISESEVPEIRNGTSLSGINISENDKWLFFPTLKFFNLIDSKNIPTERFRELITNKKERKSILSDLFKSFFSALFEKDLETITKHEFNAILTEQYNVQGSILKKASRFFIHGCQFLGIPISDDLTQKAKPQAALADTNGMNNQSLFENKVESAEISKESTEISERSVEISKETNTEVGKEMQQEITQQNGQATVSEGALAFIKSITLKGGRKLALTGEEDIWEMEDEDRELVFRLYDAMKSYEKMKG